MPKPLAEQQRDAARKPVSNTLLFYEMVSRLRPPKYRPANEGLQSALIKLTGRGNMTKDQLKALKSLGFSVMVTKLDGNSIYL